MPGLADPAIKIVLSGTLQGTQSWSCGLWSFAAGVSGWTQGELNAVAADLADAASAGFINFFNHHNTSTALLNGLTVYTFPAGNVEAAKVSLKAPLTGAGAGSDALPTLLAVVASLRSGIPGKSGRGRIYLPVTKAGSYGSDGQVSATALDDIADGVESMINAFNNVDLPDANVCRIGVASFFLGEMNAVESVVVNSVADVQHRREDSIAMRENIVRTIS